MQSSEDKLEWNDLALILAVGRAGSLSGAARHLGNNHSTVFRRLNAIEERVGVRFFERLPSGYRLTEPGEAAVAAAERIESEVHDLGRQILGQDTRLQGHVRVTAMEGLASLVLPAPLAEFSRRHPGVSIDIVGTPDALDLSRREAEVAIRATRKPPESSFGRRICGFRFGIYVSPAYAKQATGTPVQDLDWCLLRGTGNWLVPLIWKTQKDVDARTLLTCSSMIAVMEAVASGAGATFLPTYLGDADPRLRRFGSLVEGLTLDLWVLTHPDLRRTARVRAIMEYLHAVLLERRKLFEAPDKLDE